MKQKELDALLELHKKWLNGEQGGLKLKLRGVELRDACLRNTDLRHADLRGVVLPNADLHSADLSYADLTNADLRGADLCSAVLHSTVLLKADLSNANLNSADLKSADLRQADLRYADLISAVLCNANLNSANLYRADLRDTVLNRALLRSAKLHNADLRGADLSDAFLDNASLFCTIFDDAECYRSGVILKKPMIGWKKCKDGKIVELRIPKGAVVFCINGRKCRTNRVKVISVNGSDKETAVSFQDRNFVYVPNKTLEIDDFDLNNTVECATGIHFFKTRKEAEEY